MYILTYRWTISDVYKVNIKNIGLLSSLPIWFAVIAHPVAGTLADYLRTNIISVQKVSLAYTYTYTDIPRSVTMYRSSPYRYTYTYLKL